MAQHVHKRIGRRILLVSLALLLCLSLAAAILMIGIPMTETVSVKRTERSAQWMDALPDDLSLREIVLPGTHDSATKYCQLAFFSKCQALSVQEQLEAGARFLDIRLGFGEADEQGAPQLKLMHGFVNCRTGAMPWSQTLYLEQVLAECDAFLEEHPSETVIFAVKHEHGTEPTAEFETALLHVLKQNPSRRLLTDRIPSLGQARGKLVLMRRYPDAAKLGAEGGIPLLWAKQKGNGDLSKHTEMTDQGSYRLWVQDRFEYGNEDKWSAFLAGLREPSIAPEDLSIHFLSTKGTAKYGHPYAHAGALNPRLAALGNQELKGWIILDFLDAELAELVWSSNFD